MGQSSSTPQNRPLPHAYAAERDLIGLDHVDFMEKKLRVFDLQGTGDDSTSPVIFLFCHGLGARGGQFRYIINDLLKLNARVCGFDYFGHGESHRTAEDLNLYNLDVFAETAQSIADSIFHSQRSDANSTTPAIPYFNKPLKEGTTLVLVGHSCGAYVALRTSRYLLKSEFVPLQSLVQIGFSPALPLPPKFVMSLPMWVMDLCRPSIDQDIRKMNFPQQANDAADRLGFKAMTDEQRAEALTAWKDGQVDEEVGEDRSDARERWLAALVSLEMQASDFNPMFESKAVSLHMYSTGAYRTRADTEAIRDDVLALAESRKGQGKRPFKWVMINGREDWTMSSAMARDWVREGERKDASEEDEDAVRVVEVPGAHNPHLDSSALVVREVLRVSGLAQ